MQNPKNGTRVAYRLGQPDPQRDYERPVEKVIIRFDEGKEFESMARAIAPNLAAFREEYPDLEVEGAPTLDEVRLVVQDFTDAELDELGLARTREVSAVEVAQKATAEGGAGGVQTGILGTTPGLSPSRFASDEAYMRATAEGWNDATIEGVEGSGHGGVLTSQDVRTLIED